MGQITDYYKLILFLITFLFLILKSNYSFFHLKLNKTSIIIFINLNP